jgi:hypothetical protein
LPSLVWSGFVAGMPLIVMSSSSACHVTLVPPLASSFSSLTYHRNVGATSRTTSSFVTAGLGFGRGYVGNRTFFSTVSMPGAASVAKSTPAVPAVVAAVIHPRRVVALS